MGAIYDDLPGHEGVRGSGFGVRDEEHGAWTAACSCGWHDNDGRLPNDGSYEAVLDRWDLLHATPLLALAVPQEVAELVEHARRAVSCEMPPAPWQRSSTGSAGGLRRSDGRQASRRKNRRCRSGSTPSSSGRAQGDRDSGADGVRSATSPCGRP